MRLMLSCLLALLLFAVQFSSVLPEKGNMDEHECCAEDENTSEVPSKDSCSSSCAPFSNCICFAACFGGFTHIPEVQSNKLNMVHPLKDFIISRHPASIWQPPRA